VTAVAAPAADVSPAAAAVAAAPAADAPPRCFWCSAVPGPQGPPRLRICRGCNTARYCATECQAAHWEQHKHQCLLVHQAKRGARQARQAVQQARQQLSAARQGVTPHMPAAAAAQPQGGP
jgi:hypothetical protein